MDIQREREQLESRCGRHFDAISGALHYRELSSLISRFRSYFEFHLLGTEVLAVLNCDSPIAPYRMKLTCRRPSSCTPSDNAPALPPWRT